MHNIEKDYKISNYFCKLKLININWHHLVIQDTSQYIQKEDESNDPSSEKFKPTTI